MRHSSPARRDGYEAAGEIRKSRRGTLVRGLFDPPQDRGLRAALVSKEPECSRLTRVATSGRVFVGGQRHPG